MSRRRLAGTTFVGAIVILLIALASRGTLRGRPSRSLAETPPHLNQPELSSVAATQQIGRPSFEVRDLADGSVVPGVPIRAVDGGKSVTALADSAGVVELPVTERTRLDVVDARWTGAEFEGNTPRLSGIYWVHGWVTIDGVVRAEGDPTGFDPQKARVRVLVDGHGNRTDMPPADLRTRIVEHSTTVVSPSPQGDFRTVAPRICGLTVAASGWGWKPASQSIDISRQAETAYVELRLGRAFRIAGSLRSAGGHPLEKVSIYAYSLVSVPASDVSLESLRLRQPDGGFSGSIDLTTGKARAKFLSVGTTDKEGNFVMSVPVDGEVVLVAYAFDHAPIEMDVGVLNRDLDDLNLVAHRQPRSFVRVAVKGRVLSGGSEVFVADLSLKDGDVQPGISRAIDEEGRMPTEWLIVGRRYYFAVGEHSGHAIWQAPETLDVAKDLAPVSELPSR